MNLFICLYYGAVQILYHLPEGGGSQWCEKGVRGGGGSDPCMRKKFSQIIYEFVYGKLLKMLQNSLKCKTNSVAT